ncbi:hypothetical protein [Methanosalsum natronophilum]|uniref:hypothetical protein n=1 Tax=Methanosalsum natronophilum TaxID=768733 RepID=UPI00216A3DD8|nr:hypothetical protein [Methanosalsum natronophilum]MCS3923685.1 hypothetical protein [Methanosalsum natronophilum]
MINVIKNIRKYRKDEYMQNHCCTTMNLAKKKSSTMNKDDLELYRFMNGGIQGK